MANPKASSASASSAAAYRTNWMGLAASAAQAAAPVCRLCRKSRNSPKVGSGPTRAWTWRQAAVRTSRAWAKSPAGASEPARMVRAQVRAARTSSLGPLSNAQSNTRHPFAVSGCGGGAAWTRCRGLHAPAPIGAPVVGPHGPATTGRIWRPQRNRAIRRKCWGTNTLETGILDDDFAPALGRGSRYHALSDRFRDSLSPVANPKSSARMQDIVIDSPLRETERRSDLGRGFAARNPLQTFNLACA